MKLKNIALAALLTVSAVNAMHPDLAGKNPAQVNALYKALKARPGLPMGHTHSYDNVTHDQYARATHKVIDIAHNSYDPAVSGEFVSATHKAVPVASLVVNGETAAFMDSVGKPNAADLDPYIRLKAEEIKTAVAAIVNALCDAGGADDDFLLAAGHSAGVHQPAGAKAGQVLAFLGSKIDAIDGAALAVVPAENGKISTLASKYGEFQVAYDDALVAFADAITGAGVTPIISVAAMGRVAALAAANPVGTPAGDFARALVGNTNAQFTAALQAAVNAVL